MRANPVRRVAQAVLLLASVAFFGACQSATDSQAPGDSAIPTVIVAAAATSIATPTVSPAPTPAFECATDEQAFLPYQDDTLGIAFCYPAEWSVEDWVEGSGFLVVSPAGFDASVGETEMVLIYPHTPTVASGPFMWADTFFAQIVPDAELADEPVIIDEEEHARVTYVARGTIDGEPVSGVVSGIIQNGVSAMAIAYIYEDPQSTAVAEQIVASVKTTPARIDLAVAPERVVRSGEFFSGEWRAEQPDAYTLNVVDETPLLIVVEASAATDVTILDEQGFRIFQFTASYNGGEASGADAPDAYLLEPEAAGDYVILLESEPTRDFEEGRYRLAVYPLGGEESAVVASKTHQIDGGQTNGHEFEVTAERPQLVFVRRLGDPAVLRLSTFDTAGEFVSSNLPIMNGRVLQWMPEEHGEVRLEVSSEAEASADYEIIVLRAIVP